MTQKEFNQDAVLNRRLRQDVLDTRKQARAARKRQYERRRTAQIRRMLLNVALDSALIGAMVVAFVVLVTCMVC